MLYEHSPYAWLTRITGIMLKSTGRCKRIFQNLQSMLANSREMSHQNIFGSHKHELQTVLHRGHSVQLTTNWFTFNKVYRKMVMWCACDLRWIQIAFHGKIQTFYRQTLRGRLLFGFVKKSDLMAWYIHTHVCCCVFNAITKEQTVKL